MHFNFNQDLPCQTNQLLCSDNHVFLRYVAKYKRDNTLSGEEGKDDRDWGAAAGCQYGAAYGGFFFLDQGG